MFTKLAPACALALVFSLLSAASADEAKAKPKKKADAGKLSKALFRKLDLNGDKILDPSEAAEAKPAFKTLIEKGDSNGDGKLDAVEFDALAAKVASARSSSDEDAKKADDAKPAEAAAMPAEGAEKTVPAKPAKGKVGVKAIVQQFKTKDADGDGRLSREEFEGKPAVFARLDADGDGYIGKADLKRLRAGKKGGEAKGAGEKADAAKPDAPE